MRCYVYPAKKKRTISTSLLRKIPSLLIGVFGLTCRLVPPRAAQPGYLPVPATAGAVPPGPLGQASPCRFLRLLWGTDRAQVGICVERRSQLLGVDLAVLVQDMGIHAGNHVNLRMARCRLGWPSGRRGSVSACRWCWNDGGNERPPWAACLLPQLSNSFRMMRSSQGRPLGSATTRSLILILVTEKAPQLILGFLPFRRM